jgi:glycogen synthase
LVEAVGRALAALADPARFGHIQAQGMARDHSWRAPAREYAAAYRRIVSAG